MLVNKLVYKFREPERGEIVVFKAPSSGATAPAEKTSSSGSSVSPATTWCAATTRAVDGQRQPLDEPYIYPGDAPAKSEFDIVVPPGRLWMMGDHRSASGDSLKQWTQYDEDINIATIPTDDVVGRAFTIFWPFDRATWLSVPDGYSAIPNS